MTDLDLAHLRAENSALRARVEQLENQLNFLGQHKTLAAGISGERLVARLTKGTLTPHTTGHDVAAGAALLEVKFAKLSRPVATAPTLRWQWQKIYGQTGGKSYSHLLLMGEADPRFQQHYLDPTSPYVFFLLPFDQARPFCIKGNPLGIVLNSNPLTGRGSSKALFENWQVTSSDIEQAFTLPTS